MRMLVPALLAVLVPAAGASVTNVYHVAPVNPGAASPYQSWATAATNIQDAADAAMAAYAAGEVECLVLVSGGVYQLSLPVTVTNGVRLLGAGSSPAETVLRGGYPAVTNRCLHLSGGALAENLTLTNGAAGLLSVGGNSGGGVYLFNASLVNCRVLGNITAGASSKGAGLYMAGAASFVSNCVMAGNRGLTAAQGAGAHVAGGRLVECELSGNLGQSTSPGVGGLYAANSRVERCRILRNTGRTGGGHIDAGALLADSTIASNTSLQTYGGLVLDAGGVASNCLITGHVLNNYGAGIGFNSGGSAFHCTIRGNSGSHGVVYMNNGLLRNCLVAENTVSSHGTVVMYDDGTIENCTIARNQAALHSGGFYGNTPDMIIRNTILYGNDAPSNANWTIGNTNDGVFEFNGSDTLLPGVSNLAANPLFLDEGSGYGTNRPAPGDYRLAQASPCVDAGKFVAWMAGGRDLDGWPRIRPFPGGRVDLGCYETFPQGAAFECYALATPAGGLAPLQTVLLPVVDGPTNGLGCRWIFNGSVTSAWGAAAPFTNLFAGGFHTVTLEATNAAGQTASRTYENFIKSSPELLYVSNSGTHESPFDTPATAATNLQAAVDLASPGVSAVLAAPGLYPVLREVVVSNAVTLRGTGGSPGATVIRGGYPASTNRCLNLTGAGALVANLSIQNGYVTGQAVDGGGVLMTAAATLEDCEIRGNTAGASSQGGGVYMTAGTLRRCRIAANTNSSSSATYSGGGGVNMSAGLLENCLIVSNVARLDGGGVALRITGAMRGCLVAANQGRYGGGLYLPSNTGHKQRIDNGTIVGNLATNGGGVYSLATAALATNTIVWFNKATATGGADDIQGMAAYFAYSCSPALAAGVNGNTTADPGFAFTPAGYGPSLALPPHFRVGRGSPCADTGAALSWMTDDAEDIEGRPRVQGGGPNRGAYETLLTACGTLLLLK